jgi:transcriptional regulator with XRE-family HTH domain
VESLVDRDTSEVIALLRDAVATSGLSQNAFARALGTSPARLSTYLTGTTQPSARFCMRARRIGRALATTANRGLMSAPVTAALMRKHVHVGDPTWAWRMLLQGRDHLAEALASDDPALIDSWEAAAGDAGSPEWNTLLSALTAHEFDKAGAQPPSWTQTTPLPDPWVPEHPFLSPERVQAATPDWLRRLNLYVPERDLITA